MYNSYESSNSYEIYGSSDPYNFIQIIKHEHDKDIEHIGFRENNVYMLDLKQKSDDNECFLSKDNDP